MYFGFYYRIFLPRFSDPDVLLERYIIKPPAPRVQDKKNCDSINVLVKKGNEGKTTNDPHICFFCQKVYPQQANLKIHMKNIHCKKEKFHCDLCPKFYHTKNSIYYHMRQAHVEKRFSCKVCGYQTFHKSWLELHEKSHKPKVECPICKKQVNFLKQHMQNHTPKVSCPICHKSYFKHNRKSHMKTHNKKCLACDKIFNDSAALRRLVRHWNVCHICVFKWIVFFFLYFKA